MLQPSCSGEKVNMSKVMTLQGHLTIMWTDILRVVSPKICLNNVTTVLLLKCQMVFATQESCKMCG